MALLLGGGKVKSRGKTQSAREFFSGKSSSGTSRQSTPTPKATAPKTITPTKPVTSTRTLTGVNVAGLTDEQKKLLKKKGISIGGATTSAAPKMTQAQIDARNQRFFESQAPTTDVSRQAVRSQFGNILGTGIKPTTPQLEFSVTPGAKTQFAAPTFQMPSTTAAQSTMTGEDRVALQREMETERITPEAVMAATILTPLPGDELVAAGLLAKGSRTGFTQGVRNTLYRVFGKSKADKAIKAVTQRAAPVTQAVTRAVSSPAGQVAGRSVSSLGNAIRATAAAGLVAGTGAAAIQSFRGATQKAGQVRNALPPSGEAPTGQTGTIVDPVTGLLRGSRTETAATATGVDTSPEATESPVSEATTVAPTEPTTGVSGRPQFLSASGTGPRASGAVVGEPESDRFTAAQQAAMELQRATGAETGVGVSPVGDQVDLANLAATRDRTKALLEQYGSEAVTLPEFKQGIQDLLAGNLANLNATQPTPAEPVVETPEQFEWLLEQPQEEQYSITQLMDSVRRELGISDLQAQKIDITKQMNAVNETYQAVIDDIKKNPNFPKGLAARRMSEIFEDQKFAANQLLAQLELIEDQLTVANDELNFRFGLAKEERNQAIEDRNTRLDMFGYLVDSNAVGGLNDTEIRQWSQETGIPEAAIRSLKSNALTPDRDYGVRWENDEFGNTYMITYDKNNPLAGTEAQYVGSFGTDKSTTPTLDKTELRSEITSFLTNTAVADQLGRSVTLSDLVTEFPEMDVKDLEDIFGAVTAAEPTKQEEEAAWWQFWK